MSVDTVLAEALKTHLAGSSLAGSPTVSRFWRSDVTAKDVPANGLIIVTLSSAEREKVTRAGFLRRVTVQVTSIARTAGESKDGPTNADTFSALHEAIGTACDAFDPSTHALARVSEALPLEGETNDGVPLLISSYALTFAQR